jgi:hypothetical protein
LNTSNMEGESGIVSGPHERMRQIAPFSEDFAP